MSILGSRVRRVEDARLLTSGGIYVGDFRNRDLESAGWVTFVRSPVAHALITRTDTSAASKAPGVLAVLTARDVNGLGSVHGAVGPFGPPGSPFAEPLIAADRVRYVGEPVALVITRRSQQGQDAAELVDIDYHPLPPAVTPDGAVTGQSLLFPSAGTNIAARGGSRVFNDAPFRRCDVVLSQRIVNQRVAPVPMEGRAVAAYWKNGQLTVWVSSQNAQVCQQTLARHLGLAPAVVRVKVPDVGGGFGAKIGIDRDAVAVAWAAIQCGIPVRWTETRSENLVGMTHGRAQLQYVKIGGSRTGRILAYRLDIVQDSGAYPRVAGFLPGTTCQMAPGIYDIPHIETAFRLVVTNTTPVNAYRGAGRPEATAAIERMVDLFAGEIGMDPAEVRRRNAIPPERFPFTTATGAVYDSGRYVDVLNQVLATAGYRQLRAEQKRRRECGAVWQLGIGLSCYVEITAGDARAGETARIKVNSDGHVMAWTGSSPQGQGHDTTWAMLIQHELGIPMDRVTVLHGDTATVPVGIGTHGSRSLQLGGSALQQAAVVLKRKARRMAAELLEVSETDLMLDTERGMWVVRGDPGSGLSWAQLARHDDDAQLTSIVKFTSGCPTFPFGAHLSVVEVDTETGKVRLARHVAADDAGRIINPLLTEGQRHGGIAQGAGQALLEEMQYDLDGNPLTATLADYPAVSATDLPSFKLLVSQTPTDRNPLGVKGIGEAGTIGSIPAVQNAVINALSHLGVRHIDMPLTPQRVWAAIVDQKPLNPD